MLNRLFREQKGFNLTELMVVSAIIAILVVLAVPVYTTSRAVKNKSCKGNLRTMDGAIEAYHSDKDECLLNSLIARPILSRKILSAPGRVG